MENILPDKPTAPPATHYKAGIPTFQDGHLVKFSMDLRASYTDARDDITKRIGIAPEENAIPYHNGFGATWSDYGANWNSDSIYVELYQGNNPADRTNPRFVAETQELHKKSMDKLKNAPRPLD